MVDKVKIITARRAYVFAPDDLRLSTLSTGEMSELILRHFDFQGVSLGTPPPTFGEVPATLPPGVVFSLGSVRSSEGSSTPIRFLHFEPQRIIIDVAGPSSALDQVFEQLKSLLGEVEAPDGSPVIGEPTNMLNYSEVSARLSVPFDSLVSKALFSAAQRGFADDEEELKAMPVSIRFQVDDPASPIVQPEAGQTLQVRAGTRPDERIYFSAAGLTTHDNLAWLEDLDSRMNKT